MASAFSLGITLCATQSVTRVLCVLCVLQAHVNSKKYQQLVRDSGEAAPAPIIMVKQLKEDEATASTTAAAAAPAGEHSRGAATV